jgi:peptidoglycan/LPS O-acetylase OafA/YrhL
VRSRDPGLQPERTGLAWQRTGIACTLVGSAAALGAAHRGSTWVLGLAVVAIVAVGVVALAGTRLPLDAPFERLVLGAAGTLAIAAVGVALALS